MSKWSKNPYQKSPRLEKILFCLHYKKCFPRTSMNSKTKNSTVTFTPYFNQHLHFVLLFQMAIRFPEPPQPTKKCPRKNGFFAHPDPSVCNVFYNCIDGDAIEIVCTTGLHFDEYSGTCVWPDTANRQVKIYIRFQKSNLVLSSNFYCSPKLML